MLINLKYILLTLLGGIAIADIQAQQRFVDIEAELISPAGDVVSGSGLPLQFYIKNQGPDDLVNGDTLFYQLKFENAGSYEYLYVGELRGEGVPAGTAATYSDSYLIGFNFGDIKEPVTLDFCLWLYTRGINPVTGETVTLNHTDTNFSNNKHCKAVRVLPKPGTGMELVTVGREGLRLYPNPVITQVTLQWDWAEVTTVRIFDALGRQVLQEHLPLKPFGSSHTIDVRQLQPGMYYLQCHNGAVQDVQKLLIQR